MTKQLKIKLMKPSNKRENGVTILELLIYMALLSIFLVLLLDIFTTTLRIKLSNESTSALNQDSRYIFSKLAYDINNADGIVSPAVGSSSSVLKLTFAESTATYSSVSGDLIEASGSSSMKLNGLDTGMDSLSFKNIGGANGKPTIQIVYTLRSKILLSNSTQTQTINTTVGLR